LLYLSVDLPEAEVVFVDGGHFCVPLLAPAQKPSASQTANSETTSRAFKR
jgi:hypothetical protein